MSMEDDNFAPSAKVTEGEKIQQQLLSGYINGDVVTDMLMNGPITHTHKGVVEALMPMAQLRAEQIETALKSDDPKAAEELQHRYETHDFTDESTKDKLTSIIDDMDGEHSKLGKQVAARWADLIINNDRVGEVETELNTAVESYKQEKQDEHDKSPLGVGR